MILMDDLNYDVYLYQNDHKNNKDKNVGPRKWSGPSMLKEVQIILIVQ